MQILKGNILSPENLKKYDAVCFTSNGVLKKNGELVMGAGIAKVFKEKWPELPKIFGTLVKLNGSAVEYFEQQLSYTRGIYVVSFPTKYHWRNPSDIKLIEKSANELMQLVENNEWESVALPCPGVNNGGLNKEIVISVIEKILDGRITVFYL